MNLSDPKTIKNLLARHGFGFSKALGQNFLIDENVCPTMAELSGIDKDSGVIEIGAGVGVLTVELAKRAKKVVSIELDSRLLPVLAETLADYPNAFVKNADVMKTDLHALIAEEFPDMKVYVCANLPYYITSPIIMLLLESRLPIEAITVMVQKEAADRLTAEVGSRESGAVTVAVSYYAESKKLFDVPREAFLPSPKVDSCVIRLDQRREPPIEIENEEFFFKTVRAAFSQRRKTAVNSIASGLGVDKAVVSSALEKINAEANIRPEKLSLDQLAQLSNILYNQ